METSDSECFESADEDFSSDNESENSKILAALPTETVKLEKLNITEDKKLNIAKDNDVINEKELKTEKEINKSSSIDKKDPARKSVKQKDVDNKPERKDTLLSNEKESNVDKEINKSLEEKNDDYSNITIKSVKQKAKVVVDKPERKGKPQRATLGVKLGTKIKSNIELTESVKKEIVETKSDSNLESSKPEVTKINKQQEESNLTKTLKEDYKKNTQQEITNNISTEENNLWNDDDDWEPVTDVTNHSHKKEDDQFSTDWSGWGNWGVTSLLSTATMGVTTIKNHVSQGLNTVLENGIGVPQPEELARLHKEEKQFHELENKEPNTATTSDLTTFGLGSFVSGVSQITKLVETTGNKVISSGLDTLETIGKKTMEVLQEGDPGLKKKRAFLKIESDKTDLSQILREAKEKAEQENKILEEKHYSKKANYETLFDDHQGLVHLEALEMLSKQCDIKLQTLLESHTGNDLTEMQETMNQIKELCELPEDEDETEVSKDEIEEQLNTAASEMNIPISYNKIITTWMEAEQWLETINLNICNEMELYEQSINIMAQLTAIAVELFHKTGELLLIKEHRSTVDEADSLVQLTNTMTILISNAARQITEKLNEKALQSTNKEKINGLITNVYYEATNSSSYVKNAFQLLIPVLQVGAV